MSKLERTHAPPRVRISEVLNFYVSRICQNVTASSFDQAHSTEKHDIHALIVWNNFSQKSKVTKKYIENCFFFFA